MIPPRWVLLASTLAFAQPSQDAMINQTVRVFGAIMEGDKATPVSLAGGVIADGHHVITVLGCCNQTKEGRQKIAVVKIGDDFAAAKLVWTGPGDIAIIETQKELRGSSLHVIPTKFFQKGQPVFTVQIPEKGAPTVAQSTADEIAQPEKAPAPVIRVKATSDSVDAGGPLFDGCGNVMGINVFVDGGVQYAFVIDGVGDGLQKAGIQAAVADRACGEASNGRNAPEKSKDKAAPTWRLPQGGEWVGAAIIAGLIGLALRRGTQRAKVSAPAASMPYQPPAQAMPAPPPAPKKASLRGIAGQYSGVAIPIDGTTVLGRDPAAANLVFTSEADSVSKRHCSIRWDAARSVFVLEDLGSTNGTFLMSGERLNPGQSRDLRPGERFYIGDQRNQFEVASD